MAKTRYARTTSERGQALLEVALTLPLLLLVAVGIFEFGRAYQTWQILTNAAREGARIAVLPGTDDDAVEERVQEYLEAGLIPDPGDADVASARQVCYRSLASLPTRVNDDEVVRRFSALFIGSPGCRRASDVCARQAIASGQPLARLTGDSRRIAR